MFTMFALRNATNIKMMTVNIVQTVSEKLTINRTTTTIGVVMN